MPENAIRFTFWSKMATGLAVRGAGGLRHRHRPKTQKYIVKRRVVAFLMQQNAIRLSLLLIEVHDLLRFTIRNCIFRMTF